METQSLFVDKFYEMDPQHEDLLGSGDMLRDGMVVLIENSMVRADLKAGWERETSYGQEKARENNRWCTVSQLKITPRYDYNERGSVMGESFPLVSFVGVYGDGVKKKRTYCGSYGWIVKLGSIPGVAGEQHDADAELLALTSRGGADEVHGAEIVDEASDE